MLTVPIFVLGGCSKSDKEIAVAIESSTSSTASTIATTTTTTTTTTTVPKVKLPNLSSYNRDQALDVLRDLGLFASLEEQASGKPEDSIVAQNPPPGVEVESGSTVKLFYAVPLVHTVTVYYEIWDRGWTNLGDGECEHRDSKTTVGQSMRLIGPDGADLSSARVGENGKVTSSELEEANGDVCQWVFKFPDVPEVATYRLVVPDGEVSPAASLEEFRRSYWSHVWYMSRP
jgi:hypothetical protein